MDSNGNLTAELRYKAWGETRYTNGSTPTTYKYTGQKQEAALGGVEGLYYYNARWHDPTLGRFISPDTVTPVVSQGVQAYDRYAYSNNNPTNYTDPSGHFVYTPTNTDECGPDGIYCLPDGEQIIENPALSPTTDDNTDATNSNAGNTANLGKPDPGKTSLPDETKNLIGSAAFYSNVSKVLDIGALLIDFYAVGVVTYGGIAGAGIALPFALGGPEVPVATGLLGVGYAELAVQPLLKISMFLGALSTVSTYVSDIKNGNPLGKEGKFPSNTINSLNGTVFGGVVPEAYFNFSVQVVVVLNDFGVTHIPFPNFN